MKRNVLAVLGMMAMATACGDETISPDDTQTTDSTGTSGKSDEFNDVEIAAGPERIYLDAVTDCYNVTGDGLASGDVDAFGEVIGCIIAANDDLFLDADKTRNQAALDGVGTFSTISFDMMASATVLCDAAGPTNARAYVDGSPPEAACLLQHVEDLGMFALEYAYPETGHDLLVETTADEVQRSLFADCFAELDSELDGIYNEAPADMVPDLERDAHIALVDCMKARNAEQVPAIVSRLDAEDLLADEELLRNMLDDLAHLQGSFCAAAIDSSGEVGTLTFATQLSCEARFQTRTAQVMTGLAFDHYLDISQ